MGATPKLVWACRAGAFPRRGLWIAVLAALLVLAGACGGKSAQPASGRLQAFVSILPQAAIVERVGGGLVEVHVLVGPGQSPHTYEPTPQQMAALAEARVFFRIGVPFETTLIRKIADTVKGLEVVDTRKGVPLRQMAGHDEDEGHDHEAGAPDPHIWLDPSLVKTQARTVCDALAGLDPAHKADFERNLAALDAALDAVNAKAAAMLAPFRGREVFVFHPAFGYFCAAYGLKEVPVQAEGKEPSAQQLAALIASAKAQGVKVIFVQPEFSKRTAEVLAESIGARVVPLDPLARDLVGNFLEMAEKIRDALQGAQS